MTATYEDLFAESDWLRQQLESKDEQLALLWRENHLLRGRNESLELSRVKPRAALLLKTARSKRSN
jgi:hypothetical protein